LNTFGLITIKTKIKYVLLKFFNKNIKYDSNLFETITQKKIIENMIIKQKSVKNNTIYKIDTKHYIYLLRNLNTST